MKFITIGGTICHRKHERSFPPHRREVGRVLLLYGWVSSTPKQKRFGFLSFVFLSNLQHKRHTFFTVKQNRGRKKDKHNSHRKKPKKRKKFLSFFGPTSYDQSFQIFNQRQVRLLSIFVGQSLYLFEVRHNPAKDFSGTYVCSTSLKHVLG